MIRRFFSDIGITVVAEVIRWSSPWFVGQNFLRVAKRLWFYGIWLMMLALCVLIPTSEEQATYRIPSFEELWPGLLVDPFEQLETLSSAGKESPIFLDDEAFAQAFPIPDELKYHVALWKDTFGRYAGRQIVLYDSWYCQLVYEVVDLDTEKTSVTTKIRQYRALLRNIARKEKQNQLASLTPEEARVYTLFDTITEDDKFNKAAGRQMRAQSGQYERFLQALQRLGMYQQQFMQIFQKHELPVELIWLPFVESYFNYKAYSSAKAAGVWQFIPSTARLYGLHMSAAVDERYDPFKAAEAAAKLLKANYELLGTWPLAVTAYNHGTGGMLRAVRQLDTTDFGEIALNYRSSSFGFYSRNYYAEFVAIAQLMRENQEHFQAIDSLPAVAYEEVSLDQRMYVNDIVKKLSLSIEQLAELNRDLKGTALQSRIPIPKHFRLKLPQGKKQEFMTYFQASP